MSTPPSTWPDSPWPTALPGEVGMRVGFPEVPRPAPTRPPVQPCRNGGSVARRACATDRHPRSRRGNRSSPTAGTLPPLQCQAPPIGDIGTESVKGPQTTTEGRLYKNHLGFTVRYYPFPGTATYPGVTTSANGITLIFPFKPSYGGTSDLTIIGQPDGGATPQQIVDDTVGQIAPNAQLQFQMPQAYVGYWPAYGEAFVTQVPSADGNNATYELIVMAAVHNGFGIAVVASGRLLDRVTPGSSWWDGHPSPAAINVAYIADGEVNSIVFPGAPSP